MDVPGPPRDLVGYGRDLPSGGWPGESRIALSVVVNYEEGSERSFAMGDGDQETSTEWNSYDLPPGVRNLAMETMYEYGSQVGVWRIVTSSRGIRCARRSSRARWPSSRTLAWRRPSSPAVMASSATGIAGRKFSG